MTNELLDLKNMWRVRIFEERVRELRLAGEIVGSVHLCIGQEAGPVGLCTELEVDDALFATYRGHGWALARGVPPSRILAELLGRKDGVNGGRGGSAYFSAPEWGFFGENSIVGAGLPIAVGAAIAGRFDGSRRIAVCVFGDGALNQGAAHEALNMASAFKLPVVFICENNGYSELTRIEEMVGDAQLWRRARSYGMAGARLNGNDVEHVRLAASVAIKRARAGEGPTLLELMTERLVGHYIGDPEHYRAAGEVASALEREPIARMIARLRANSVDEEVIEQAHRTAQDEIDQATETALASPLVDPASALEDVYV